MTRILFINIINPNRKKEVEIRHPALGTLYLASYLQKYGGYTDIQVSELGNITEQTFLKANPDIVGISSITQNFNIAKNVASQIKQFMDIPVIVGGIHISSLPQNLTKNMDVGVIGEGEQTMLELAQAYETNGLDQKKLGKIDGIVYRLGTHLQITSKRKFITPLDNIPFPARHLIHYEPTQIHCMLTSRGCPYHCVFCCPVANWGNIRYFSPEYVVAEVRQIIEAYHPRSISLSDDLFCANKQRLHEIAVLMKKEDFYGKVRFTTSARANLVDEETCRLLKEIGVFSVGMGLESGNSRVLKYLKGNNVTVEQNSHAVELLAQYDLKPTATFVIGSPDETAEEIRDTLTFIKASKLASFRACMLVPFPNTQVWIDAKAKGLVSDDMDWDRFEFNFADIPESRIIVSELPRKVLLSLYRQFGDEERKRLRKRLISQGLKHPGRIFPYVKWKLGLLRRLHSLRED